MGRIIDLTGRRFGRLAVSRFHGRADDSRRRFLWECKCDCGVIVAVRGDNLLSGNTLSCGCLQVERTSSSNTTHGETKDYKTSRIYYIWAGMKQRCLDEKTPNYKNYGARGIKICAEWMDFLTFRGWALANGYAHDLTIERKDFNGNYEPDNCTWIPGLEQNKNKRNVPIYSFMGETGTLPDLAKLFGMSDATLRLRISKGQSIEAAITTPVRQFLEEIEFNGMRLRLVDWAKRLGISKSTLHSRIIRGWPLSEALSPKMRRCSHGS